MNLNCLDKFSQKDVIFGEESCHEPKIEKYIFDTGVTNTYIIPSIYDVGAKLIDKDTYNVDIVNMSIDFGKMLPYARV